MQIKARKCFVPFSPSRWVAKVYLTCDNMIAVEYRHGQHVKKILPHGPGAYLGHGGVPSVCCLYPGTQGALAENLYDLAEVWSYGGEWVHKFLYKKFGYKLVSPPAACGSCATACSLNCNPANPSQGQAVTITCTVTNTDGSSTKGAAPQGTVTISVDGTELCVQTLPENDSASQNWGTVQCTWTAQCTPTTSHTITATYTPSDADFASTSCSTSLACAVCCDNLPSTLHLTIANSGTCNIDGTYALTWNATSSSWTGGSGNATSISFYCNNAGGCGGYTLNVYVSGTYCFNIAGSGTTAGTWSSCSCSTPSWGSNPTAPNENTCVCYGVIPPVAATFTVTS